METCPASEPARSPAKAWPKASSSMWPWGTWPRPSTALQSQPWSQACCSPALYPATSAARDWLKSGPFGLAKEGRPIGSEIQSSKVWVALGRGQADGFWKDGGHCSLVIPRLFFSTSLSCFSIRDKWVCYSHNVQERLSGSSNNSNSTSKNNVDGKRRYKHIINND